jgi:hypothetical protein
MNTPMNTQLIVVGTDTGCGKTIVTGLIAHYFIQSKRSVWQYITRMRRPYYHFPQTFGVRIPFLIPFRPIGPHS